MEVPASKPTKQSRVHACVQCQARKVKCDRRFPCANCTKAQTQCVPAALLPARPRRRRFAERELLDRLHSYESLLQQNNIPIDRLHDKPRQPAQTQAGNEDHALGRHRVDIERSGSVQQAPSSSSWFKVNTPVCNLNRHTACKLPTDLPKA
jgi:hypothetical protein